MVEILLQPVGRARIRISVPSDITTEHLYSLAESSCGHGDFTLVFKGTTVISSPDETLTFAGGECVLVVPKRKQPDEKIVRAVLGVRDGADDEDVSTPAALPADAPSWEKWIFHHCKHTLKFPEYVLEWLVIIRMRRMFTFLAVVCGAVLAARVNLGPVFILTAIIVAIFTNLGTRRAGEASAYSVFNNFQALPGQLDAGEIDRQIRHGQM